MPRWTTFDLFFLPQSLSRSVDNSDSKVHALHYVNDLLVRVRLSFQKLQQNRCSTCRNNTKKCLVKELWRVLVVVKSTDHDKPHFDLFSTTISTSKKISFFFRARAEKLSSLVRLRTSNFWLVRSEHAHASYPGRFFRPPGFSPYRGREERRVQGLDYPHPCPQVCFALAFIYLVIPSARSTIE